MKTRVMQTEPDDPAMCDEDPAETRCPAAPA